MRISIALLFSLFIFASSYALASSVNINNADAAAIEASLVGVGPDKAAAIVQYRKEHGPFKSVADLGNVKGIGEKTIEKNRDNITVGN